MVAKVGQLSFVALLFLLEDSWLRGFGYNLLLRAQGSWFRFLGSRCRVLGFRYPVSRFRAQG